MAEQKPAQGLRKGILVGALVAVFLFSIFAGVVLLMAFSRGRQEVAQTQTAPWVRTETSSASTAPAVALAQEPAPAKPAGAVEQPSSPRPVELQESNAPLAAEKLMQGDKREDEHLEGEVVETLKLAGQITVRDLDGRYVIIYPHNALLFLRDGTPYSWYKLEPGDRVWIHFYRPWGGTGSPEVDYIKYLG